MRVMKNIYIPNLVSMAMGARLSCSQTFLYHVRRPAGKTLGGQEMLQTNQWVGVCSQFPKTFTLFHILFKT